MTQKASKPSRRLILDLLKEHGQLTINQIVEKTGRDVSGIGINMSALREEEAIHVSHYEWGVRRWIMVFALGSGDDAIRPTSPPPEAIAEAKRKEKIRRDRSNALLDAKRKHHKKIERAVVRKRHTRPAIAIPDRPYRTTFVGGVNPWGVQ